MLAPSDAAIRISTLKLWLFCHSEPRVCGEESLWFPCLHGFSEIRVLAQDGGDFGSRREPSSRKPHARSVRNDKKEKSYLISLTGSWVPKSCPFGPTARATIDVNACLYSGYCCANALINAIFCWKVFT